MNTINVYTDGSCLSNPGPGGYCALLELPELSEPIELSGGEAQTTNNRMELEAVIKAFEHLAEENAFLTEINLYSDSQYVINGITSWMEGWKEKGFSGIKNPKEWEKLYNLVHPFSNLHCFWVKGHAGHPQNELCDTIARNKACEYQKGKENLTVLQNGKITIVGSEEEQEQFDMYLELFPDEISCKLKEIVEKLYSLEQK